MVNTRDWAHLLPELLQKISCHLSEIGDHIRFCAVCIPWQSASRSVVTNLPTSLPWLILPFSSSNHASQQSNTLPFLSLSENRVYTLPFPDAPINRMLASSHGYLILLTHTTLNGKWTRSLSLLNPITRSLILLPPLWILEFSLVDRVKFFKPDLLAVLSKFGPYIFLCRVGETSWTTIDISRFLVRIQAAAPYTFGDFAYHKGGFFIINPNNGNAEVYDGHALQKVADVPAVQNASDCVCYYLVESSSEELILLLKGSKSWKKRFELFRLDESKGEMKWVEVNSIGDDALFVDQDQAMCFVATEDSKVCKGNYIYFVDYLGGNGDYENYGVGVFDIRGSQVECEPLFSDKALQSKLPFWIGLRLG